MENEITGLASVAEKADEIHRASERLMADLDALSAVAVNSVADALKALSTRAGGTVVFEVSDDGSVEIASQAAISEDLRVAADELKKEVEKLARLFYWRGVSISP